DESGQGRFYLTLKRRHLFASEQAMDGEGDALAVQLSGTNPNVWIDGFLAPSAARDLNIEFSWNEKLLVRAEAVWCDHPDGSGAKVLMVRKLFGTDWNGPLGY
ncbi:MAG: hypothetical protein KDN22_33010, partial [Verrucomicrobiae bacterium]|nr:hypothetical protein [Verrucomicrobiae bacterium]